MAYIPCEVLEEILLYSDLPTVVQCCLVCRRWYQVIMSLSKVWETMCVSSNIILHHQKPLVSDQWHHVTQPLTEQPLGHGNGIKLDADKHDGDDFDSISDNDEDMLLHNAAFYQNKIRKMLRRCREFNMKGYNFAEKLFGESAAQFIACNSTQIMIIRDNSTVFCVDNSTWNETHTWKILHNEEEVVCFQCNDSVAVIGLADGHVTAYNTRRNFAVEWEARTDLGDVKCLRIEEQSSCVAILRGSGLVFLKNGELLQTMPDIGHFSWKKFLWDGWRPKHAIFENILNFSTEDELFVVSPEQILVLQRSRDNQQYVITTTKDTTINPGRRYCSTCMNVYYFWPSVLVSDLYICCRTSCAVRLYDRHWTEQQTLVLLKTFPRSCSVDPHQRTPSDRCNLMAVGSKFLVGVDPFIFPRIMIFDMRSGALLSTIGDHPSECDGQAETVPHRIYHMSYFVKIPSPSWLDGDFHDDNPRPCLVAFNHGDTISKEALFVFHLENFRVRVGKN